MSSEEVKQIFGVDVNNPQDLNINRKTIDGKEYLQFTLRELKNED